MAVAQRAHQNHYETLGVTTLASVAEIRRAYRILARRYHPDVNPGKNSEERFKAIADAYKVLSDQARRRDFDRQLEEESGQAFDRGHAAYQQAIRRAAARDRARQRFEAAQNQSQTQASPNARTSAHPQPPGTKKPSHQSSSNSVLHSLGRFSSLGAKTLRNFFTESPKSETLNNATHHAARSPHASPASRVSVIEVSIPMRDAIHGGRKSVEIREPEGTRKVSIRLPPGVRDGSVLRTRAKRSDEELVVIVRVAPHPYLDLQRKGLVCLVPITVQEAVSGAQIMVPTLEDQVVLKIPQGSQSGAELRLKGRGVTHPDGTRGDLIYRLMIQVPSSSDAVGLQECVGTLERYYGNAVRTELPKQLLE